MSKLDKMTKYLEQAIEIDMQGIEELKMRPLSQIRFMGGVKEWYACCGYSNYYYETVAAIKVAGYKYPVSDSVWEKAVQVVNKIVREKLSLIEI